MSSKELNESLITACAELELEQVKEIIAKGADVNYRRDDDDGGLSALHECCMTEEATEIIKYLLSLKDGSGNQRVNVNITDEGGIPPLAFAISTQNLEAVKLLHDYGAKFSLPQFEAAVAASIYPTMLKYILSCNQGKNPNVVDPDTGKTPALMAALASESVECTRVLKEAGADFTAVDLRKKNVLHLAAQNLGAGGAILKYLLDSGALSLSTVKESMINARDGTEIGFTPLLEACSSANAEVVQILLSLGADKNIKSLPTAVEDSDDENEDEEEKELTCGDVLEAAAEAVDEDDEEEAARVRACLLLLEGEDKN